MSPQNTAPLIRLRDAARALGCSPAGLRMMVRRGDGPTAVRVGHLIKFRQCDLENYLVSRTIAPMPTHKSAA
jgi:predicted DNA-binding transcriptional regulator AlpA